MKLTFDASSSKEIDDILTLFKEEEFFIISFADRRGDVAHERNALFISNGLLSEFASSDRMWLHNDFACPKWGMPYFGIGLKANGLVFTRDNEIYTDITCRVVPFASKHLGKIVAQLKSLTEFNRDITATAISASEILKMDFQEGSNEQAV